MLISRPDALPEEKLAFVLAYCDCERDLTAACEQVGISLDKGREFLADKKVSRNVLFELNLRQTQGVSEDNILRQVARMTFFDPRKLFDAENRLLPMHDVPDEIAAAITGVKVTKRVLWAGSGQDRVQIGEEYDFDYKFVDRNSSVEKLMKYMGMFELDNRQVGDAVSDMLKQVYSESTSLPLVEHKPRSIVGPKADDIEPIELPQEDLTVEAKIPDKWQNPYAR